MWSGGHTHACETNAKPQEFPTNIENCNDIQNSLDSGKRKDAGESIGQMGTGGQTLDTRPATFEEPTFQKTFCEHVLCSLKDLKGRNPFHEMETKCEET